jgi:hypothetical protein
MDDFRHRASVVQFANVSNNNNRSRLIIINIRSDCGLLRAPRTSLAGLVLLAAFLAHELLLVKRKDGPRRSAPFSAARANPD